MIFNLVSRKIGLAILFLAASGFVGANAHPIEPSSQGPNGHQHFHCHQSKTCHSHGHDATHH